MTEALEHKIHVRDARTVNIGDRVRQDSGDIRGIAESLATVGQIQPIVLNGDELVAGFRRLTACALLDSENRSIKSLPQGHILCIQFDDLTQLEAVILEFEENRKRKGFTDAEDAIAITKIKALIEQEEGFGISSRELAERLGFSTAHISMALKVADAVQKGGKKELLKEKSVFGAYKKLGTMEKLEEARRRADREVDISRETALLHNGDGITWLRDLPPDSIDFVNFDPPWGIGIDKFDRNQLHGTFDDSAETGAAISEAMIPELFRVLKPDSFMVMWFGMQFYQPIREALTNAGFRVPPNPHIWHKVNKAGSQSDPTLNEMNAYEVFFVARKGDPRIITTGRSNVLTYPMPTDRVHYAQKNTDLMVDILERYTLGNMLCLDPTFGSGSFFIACQRLGRPYTGAELDPENFRTAIDLLKRSRLAK